MNDDFSRLAGQTELSAVDGQIGRLTIRGYPIEELAAHASYEEAAYLLWYGELPDAAALADYAEELARYRPLHPLTVQVLEVCAAQRLAAIDALQVAAPTLGLDAPPEAAPPAITARLPSLVATYWRMLNGQSPVEARLDLGHTANYLYILNGALPHPACVKALETYLVTMIDHGINASTFAARVIT
ncbi:MAG: citrate/2-methylcitrate synthase, partial [Anaerolineae bacterium]|nr:hypothetical protein [Thermoflexales bacterium]MDW8406370.1 citrate/2-methylcitrate synthase [Anaerolineae bacterium]